MTCDDIIRMAREAGFIEYDAPKRNANIWTKRFGDEIHLQRFAALVAAAEREACAKVCDDLIADGMMGTPEWNSGVLNCATDIDHEENKGRLRLVE